MKTKTAKKVIVAAMATAMGAGIVGSISGTVAWYQYSTRSTVAYQGAAAHCSENLQIRLRSSDTTIGAWKSDLTSADIANYLKAADTAGGAGRTVAENTLRPVTSGELAADKVAAKLYKNPIYQYGTMSTWGEAKATEDYIVIPLELRVLDVDGDTTEDFLAKKIYVSDVTIQAATDNPSGSYDMSSAVRVGVKAGTTAASTTFTDYATFSTTGTDVNVFGKLDLNNDGKIDQDKSYDFETGAADIVYGVDTKKASSTKNVALASEAASDEKNGIVNDADPYTLHAKEIGSTTASATLSVDLLIYLEGWTELSDKTATSGTETVNIPSIWDITKADGAKFNVGVRFTTEAHKISE